MCCEKLRQNLERHFREIISGLQGAIECNNQKKRLEDFLQAAPTALTLLAEPWWPRMDAARRELFFACADLHLYARILDDAVDEEDAANRKALLRMQPVYWQAVQTLAIRRIDVARDAFSFICATVEAAGAEQTEPDGWAKKNFHLLLIPLCLAHRKSFFEKYRKHLAIAIALLQAEDEASQGKINDFPTLCNFTAKAAGCAAALSRAGWPHFAERIIRGCKALLNTVETI